MTMNSFKTAVLMAGLAGLLMLIGGLMGGKQGIVIALVLSLGINFFSFWFSDRIVLKMYRARPLSAGERPDLVKVVRELSQEAGLPMPELYIIPSETPNAFATGRNPSQAVVGVTEGILDILNANELKGVLGHEMAHIQNRDILLQTIAATLASAVTFLAFMARWGAIMGLGGNNDRGGGGIFALLAMAIFAPIAAALIRFAISRSEEFKADKTGAEITRRPSNLASALKKLHSGNRRHPFHTSPSHNATAHMFIVNPLSGRSFSKLFSTHPPVEERIKRLEKMAQEMGA
jgi:heat shock protein HtpX